MIVFSTVADNYKGYTTRYPTLPSVNDQLEIKVSVDVQQIVNINDLDLNFEAKFRLRLRWFDVQLWWVNLKNSSFWNFLNNEEKKKIWMPKLRMEESDYIRPIKVDESATVYVEKVSKGSSAIYPTNIDRSLYYSGVGNPLNYERDYQEQFFCPFYYHWYLYEVQVSFVMSDLRSSVGLIMNTKNTIKHQ